MFLIKMKIHILGADGFVGQRLQNFFSRTADTKGYSSSECDLLNLESVYKLPKFTKEDAIIMVSSIIRLRENSFESMTKNIQMADNISKFIQENSPGYFVFLSTIDIYGINPNTPINENNLLLPNDYYSLSKLMSEFLLKKTCSEKNIPLLILRMSGLYGRGDEGKSTINKLVESAIKYRKITIIGEGYDRRDFVYVEDIGRLIQEAIARKKEILVNVATGKSYSIKEIAELIKNDFPFEIIIEKKPEDERAVKRAREISFDISLFRENFPKFEFTDLKQGLRLYLQEHKII